MKEVHFLFFLFLGTMVFAQDRMANTKYEGDEEKLGALADKFDSNWQRDSLKAVDVGLPFRIGEENETYTFVRWRDNFPVYVKTNTLDEVQSYYGDDLWSAPYGVTGTNLASGIWEAFLGTGALPDPTNTNFLNNGIGSTRVLLANTGSVSSHANNVALRIAGDGFGNANSGVGIAKTSTLIAWDVTNVISELATNATSLLVSNHSYSELRGWSNPIPFTLNGVTQNVNWWSESNVSQTIDYGFGRYSSNDAALDLIAYLAPYHCIVKAAGNDRGDSNAVPLTTFNTLDSGVTYTFDTYSSPVPEVDGGTNGFDCIPSSSTAKNAFIIGACSDISGGYMNSSDVIIRSFSGFGPTNDGRLKPDFVAPGEPGTSYSAPNVSGVILLLQQIASNNLGYVLYSSTIKALLAQTAYEAGNAGPDYKHGWGLINPKGAADMIVNSSKTHKIVEDVLPNGQSKKFYAFLGSSGDVRATLSWLDPDGTPRTRTYDSDDLTETTTMLVNDLNLKVTEVNTTSVTRPFILDPTNPNNVATTGTNTRDNIEQVFVSSANSGWYEIEVSHTGTLVDDDGLTSSQLFSLVMSGFDVYSCLQDAAVTYTTEWESGAWSGGTPTSSTNAIISENITLGANLQVNNLIVKQGVTISLGSFNLEIKGSFVSEGAVTAQGSGKVLFNGTAAQKMCGEFNFDNLELNNSNGLTIDPTEGLTNLSGLLTLTAGVLQPNSRMRLRSVADASKKEYAQIHNVAGSVSGNLFFENTVQGSSGWRNMASPVSTVIGDVLEDQNQYNIASSGGSVYKWNAANSQWEAPNNVNDPFNATTPYTVFFGTSTVGSNNFVFNDMPFTCRLVGQPNNGPIDNTLAYHNGSGGSFTTGDEDGWNLISNPYPENLDWAQINGHADFTTNINGSYYIWDASQQKYLSHTGLAGDGELAGKIAPMQAFYVKLNNSGAATTDAFDFTNAQRTSSKAQFLKTGTPYLALGLYNDSNSIIDRTHIGIGNQATQAFDSRWDAYQLKLSPVSSPLVYTGVILNGDTSLLSVNFLPANQKEITIPVFAEVPTAGIYGLGIDSTNFPNNWTVELIEASDSSLQNLSTGTKVVQLIPDNPKLFWLRINAVDVGLHESDFNELEAKSWFANQHLQVQLTKDEPSLTTLMGINGEVILQYQANEMEFAIPISEYQLASGIYLVKIQTKSGQADMKVMKVR